MQKPSSSYSSQKKPGIPLWVLVCLFLMVGMMFIVNNKRTERKYLEEATSYFSENYTFSSPESTADGTYRSEATTTFLHVVMDVTVQDHKLTKIEVIEKMGKKGRRVDSIIDTMLANNTSTVQAVKNEEPASLVYILCVDNALSKGKIADTGASTQIAE